MLPKGLFRVVCIFPRGRLPLSIAVLRVSGYPQSAHAQALDALGRELIRQQTLGDKPARPSELGSPDSEVQRADSSVQRWRCVSAQKNGSPRIDCLPKLLKGCMTLTPSITQLGLVCSKVHEAQTFH